METGEVQYGDWFTPEDLEALAADRPVSWPTQTPSMAPFAIKLNNQVGPTSDINVRKALSHAFDYDAAMEAVSGRGDDYGGPLATGLEPWHKKDLPVLRHDMEAAKAALAASAYPDGFEMDYVYVTGDANEELFGLILLEKAGELGITVNMVPMVWPDMVARAAKAETAPASMAVYSGDGLPRPGQLPLAGVPLVTGRVLGGGLALQESRVRQAPGGCARGHEPGEPQEALRRGPADARQRCGRDLGLHRDRRTKSGCRSLPTRTTRSWAATCGRSATSRSRCLNFGARRRQEIALSAGAASGT